MVLPENGMSDAAEFRKRFRANTMKLIHAQTKLARETGILQLSQYFVQMGPVREPDAVGDNLIETKAEFCRSAAHGVHELGIKEWLPPCEAQNAYAIGMSVLKEAQRRRNGQTVLPFDRDTTVWAGQVALIRTGEG
jgi:hypothetical protein